MDNPYCSCELTRVRSRCRRSWRPSSSPSRSWRLGRRCWTLQLHSLWIIPTAAVSSHVFGREGAGPGQGPAEGHPEGRRGEAAGRYVFRPLRLFSVSSLPRLVCCTHPGITGFRLFLMRSCHTCCRCFSSLTALYGRVHTAPLSLAWIAHRRGEELAKLKGGASSPPDTPTQHARLGCFV